MITAYIHSRGTLEPRPVNAEGDLPDDAVWIDLLNPLPEEVEQVERALRLDLPTLEEMREIETSSRLYQDNGAFFMTAILIHRADTEIPDSVPVTFILAERRLITLRHAEPQPFRIFAAQTAKPATVYHTGEMALVGLLDAIVDRIADILERVQEGVTELSREVFAHDKRRPSDGFETVLKKLGRDQGLVGRARESLVSISRLLSFLGRTSEQSAILDMERGVKTLVQDVTSLSDHTSYLSNNINFLLEAILGLISIEQNSIIKIFSVAAVMFLPPTLIASVYGMNFEVMPELEWPYAYPVVLALMVLSAVTPYLYFKRRGWL